MFSKWRSSRRRRTTPPHGSSKFSSPHLIARSPTAQTMRQREVATSFEFDDGTLQSSRRATLHVGENHYRVTADTFFQANRFLLLAMIREVLDQAGPLPGNVLELYAGLGFFSIPLARVAKELIAIESSRTAVRLGQQNVRINQTWQLRSAE